MSWWAYLEDEHGAVEVKHFEAGGTQLLGGSDRAQLNVTYNYGQLFAASWPQGDLRARARVTPGAGILELMLNGRSGKETEPLLRQALIALVVKAGGIQAFVESRENYWKATPANAGRALMRLLEWAGQHPEAVWRIS